MSTSIPISLSLSLSASVSASASTYLSVRSLCVSPFSAQPLAARPLLLPHSWKAVPQVASHLCIGKSSALFSVFILLCTSFRIWFVDGALFVRGSSLASYLWISSLMYTK